MNNSTFCPLLFQHLATHPHGGVTHCCIADHKNSASSSKDYNGKYYNIGIDTIKDTFNSDSFKTARLQSLNGVVPNACSRCFKEESMGVTSKRQHEINNYPNFSIDVANAITDESGYIDNVQFDFVELRLGNLCNVACRTCNPASSSKWVSDYKKLTKTINFPITNYSNLDGFNWPDQDSFWEQLINHCKNVKTFYINGGEPTLIKQHFLFLQRLIKLKKTNITLWYNINMTHISEEIIDLWKQFDEVKISCSIDDLGLRNEYIRYPTKWNTVIDILDRLKKENFKLDITQTISFMNYSNLSNFYKFFNQNYNLWIHHNFVHDPVFLSPSVLPMDIKRKAQDTFAGVFPDWQTEQLIKNCGEFDQTNWKHAKEYTRNLDSIRQQNIKTHLHEFIDIDI